MRAFKRGVIMDTLRRVGSIRKSMRKQRKPSLAPEPDPEVLSIHEEPEPPASYFTLTCTETVVTASTASFQPTHIRLIITRHRKTYSSNPVLWEPTLKSHLAGSGVWHPPFIVSVMVSPPLRSKSKGTLRHKDAFVSLENVDLKGKKKLLAKARVNLSDYYVAASVSPVKFKLKLFPETGKISGAFVQFSVHRTEQDPANVSLLPAERDEDEDVSPLNTLERRTSPISSHYNDDSQSDATSEFDQSPRLCNRNRDNSPIAMLRPSSLPLKNTITVEQPKPSENNNRKSTASTASHHFQTTTTANFVKKIAAVSSSSTTTASSSYSSKFSEKVSVQDKKLAEPVKEPEVKASRLLAEPEDTRIDTPRKSEKVVVSGIVLPTGPPPPLPQRGPANRSPLPNLLNETKEEVTPPVLVNDKKQV